jgi:hypothetical protein
MFCATVKLKQRTTGKETIGIADYANRARSSWLKAK